MNSVPVDTWKYVSENDLWSLAMNRDCPQQIRQEAMQRWLFPADYGYPWAAERLNRLRQRLQVTRAERLESRSHNENKIL